MIYCHFYCETYFYHTFLLFGKRLLISQLSVLVSSGDDEFNDEFDKKEKEDQFNKKLEDGFQNWEERYFLATK